MVTINTKPESKEARAGAANEGRRYDSGFFYLMAPPFFPGSFLPAAPPSMTHD